MTTQKPSTAAVNRHDIRNKNQAPCAPVPETVFNKKSNKTYTKGKFLGKGGFAKCYEFKDSSGQIFAMKVVPKTLLLKEHQRSKMALEIKVHRSLSHEHVVKFYDYFEDENYVYILLELCSKKSLMELLKRRQSVTDLETKYYLFQICSGVKYLHDQNIIHRDLKLGNLFLNDVMEVKIGDFGLATVLEFDGERKKTLCGTPNYIAPEILTKKGHSFEVDIWSIGCIMYTLLLGSPPFETKSLDETYKRIKTNTYVLPQKDVSSEACELIKSLLQDDPKKRPTIDMILKHDYLIRTPIPKRLPASCLTMAPRTSTATFNSFINVSHVKRKPFTEINKQDNKLEQIVEEGTQKDKVKENKQLPPQLAAPVTDGHLSSLYEQLSKVMASKPEVINSGLEDEAECPRLAPMIYVSKWVDYSDKYGLGWQLTDDSMGVLFNDNTQILLHFNGLDVHYIERNGAENYHTLNAYPNTLNKKMTLLKYFQNYMAEHLLKTGPNVKPDESDGMARIATVRSWFRTKSAIILHLSTGTLQINFFKDHSKIVVCPLMGAVTYIDPDRENKTYSMSLIARYGCSPELATRLNYAKTMTHKLMHSKSSTVRGAIKNSTDLRAKENS